jgi:hypothetical protein
MESWVTVGSETYGAHAMTYSGLTAGTAGVVYDCGRGFVSTDFPAAVSGNIALIERGETEFTAKVTNAMNAGAAAVIVYNNVPGNFLGTLQNPGSWVPVVSLSQEDGQVLRASGEVTATLVNELSKYTYNDGTSMATPYSTGAIALLASQYASETASQRISRILDRVDPLPSLAGKVATGGRLNIARAIRNPPETTISTLPASWVNRDVTFSLTASDIDSPDGILTYYRQTPPGDTTAGTTETVSAEGTTTIEYWSVDTSGNVETTRTARIMIDKTPPVTSSDATANYAAAATVNLTATDSYSGAAFTVYALDGVAATGTTVGTNEIGTHTLDFASVDVVGNTENTQTTVFTVSPDAEPPNTTISTLPEGWVSQDVTFSLTASDVGLPDNITTYCRQTPPGDTTAGTAGTVSAEGTTTIEYWSVDASGNAETTKTATVKIDKTAPALSLDATASYVGTATVHLTASDALSGLVRTECNLSASGWASGTIISTTMVGTQTLDARAFDAVGNVATRSATFVLQRPSRVTLGANKTVNYGTVVEVAGTLESMNGVALARRTIMLYRSTDKSTWTKIGQDTTTDLGNYSFRVKPTRKYYYQARFQGDAGDSEGSTRAMRVRVRPYVRTPIAPKTMRRTRSYTVYGYFKPRHKSGTHPVLIYRYRKTASGRWKEYGYVKAKASNFRSYTKYSRKIRLPYAGKWRLRAYAPADSTHEAKWSKSYDYVRVK